MSDKEVPKKVAASVIEKFGRIDILINNPGMIRRPPAVDFSEEDWSTVIEVNLSSVFWLSQAVGKTMIEQNSGKIVNIVSLLSFQGGITVPAYTASKSGVAGLTKDSPTSGQKITSTSMQLRRVIWRRIIRRRCVRTKTEIDKF